jgi:hypothetical protein
MYRLEKSISEDVSVDDFSTDNILTANTLMDVDVDNQLMVYYKFLYTLRYNLQLFHIVRYPLLFMYM